MVLQGGKPPNPIKQMRTQVGLELSNDLNNFHLSKYNGQEGDVTKNWLIELKASFSIKGFSPYTNITLEGM